jgi:hypothetical protein
MVFDGDESADDRGDHIFHRKIEPDPEDANYRLLGIIANLEHTDEIDLPPLYDRIDHLVTQVFEDPPHPEAQVQIEFSYYGYRITLDQSGNVQLMRLADPDEALD